MIRTPAVPRQGDFRLHSEHAYRPYAAVCRRDADLPDAALRFLETAKSISDKPE